MVENPEVYDMYESSNIRVTQRKLRNNFILKESAISQRRQIYKTDDHVTFYSLYKIICRGYDKDSHRWLWDI